MRPTSAFAPLVFVAWLSVDPAWADFTLAWPVACRIGETCEIQHYVDHSAGAGDARDYRCGSVTYKGHNGTDIRVLTMADERRGVDVLAAATGTVLRTRDGMADVSVAVTGHNAVRDRDCGNAVVIGHLDKFETQYCHMARGSVAVKPGDTVTAGQVIGHIGLSGDTEFPHLHITVRHDGTTIDPFAYGEPDGACSGGVSLWRAPLQAELAYKAGTVLDMGFSPRAVSMEEVDNGAGHEPLTAASPAVLAFVWAISLRQGDVQRLMLTGPKGPLLDHSEPPLLSNKDQIYLGFGRKRPAEGWGDGPYAAIYTVTRDGIVVIRKTILQQIGLPPTKDGESDHK